jgi:hypothetical protein
MHRDDAEFFKSYQVIEPSECLMITSADNHHTHVAYIFIRRDDPSIVRVDRFHICDNTYDREDLAEELFSTHIFPRKSSVNCRYKDIQSVHVIDLPLYLQPCLRSLNFTFREGCDQCSSLPEMHDSITVVKHMMQGITVKPGLHQGLDISHAWDQMMYSENFPTDVYVIATDHARVYVRVNGDKYEPVAWAFRADDEVVYHKTII